MSERYLISGVQLGCLIELIKTDKKQALKMLGEISENNFVGKSENPLTVDCYRLYISLVKIFERHETFTFRQLLKRQSKLYNMLRPKKYTPHWTDEPKIRKQIDEFLDTKYLRLK